MNGILKKLEGNDLRSIGRADEVVKDVLENPSLFHEVFIGMEADHPVIRMRSADVIEKVSKLHPDYLQPYKEQLVNEISKINQQEVRWHVAQMFSYLELTKKERSFIVNILLNWIDTEKSKIVIVNAMQTLAAFAKKDEELQGFVIKKIEQTINGSSPAIISRGKRILSELKE